MSLATRENVNLPDPNILKSVDIMLYVPRIMSTLLAKQSVLTVKCIRRSHFNVSFNSVSYR